MSRVASTVPLVYAEGNALLGCDGSWTGLYRVEPLSYPFLTDAEKRREWGRLARTYADSGGHVSCYRVNRSYPAERFVDDTLELAYAGYHDHDGWRQLLARQQDELHGLDAHVPEVYFAVGLLPVGGASLGGGAGGGLARRLRQLQRTLGLRRAGDLTDAERDLVLEAEQVVFDRMRAAWGARACRTTTLELQWLHRRAASRGLDDPEPAALTIVSGDGRLRWRPQRGAFLDVGLVELEENPAGTLVVDGTYRQAMLVLGSLEDAEFPGDAAELLYAPLERLGFPVDVAVHAEHIANGMARSMVKKAIRDADNVAAEEAHSRQGVRWASDDRRALARELDELLARQDHPPLYLATVHLAVGAADERELRERVERIKTVFAPVAVHRPRRAQPAMFEEHLPRVGPSLRGSWADTMTVEQLGAFMPTATNHVQSEVGPVIGHLTEGGLRPVKSDPFEAARANRPTTSLFVGVLGAGKTLAMLWRAYLAYFMGALVVTVDPKPDHYLERVPELADAVRVISVVGGEDQRGMFDPLRIARHGLREDLAVSYYGELLGDDPRLPIWRDEIRRAVKDVLRRDVACGQGMLDSLLASERDQAREVGEVLALRADSGLSALGFGDQRRGSLELASAPITTLRIDGLSGLLPRAGTPRGTYTDIERLAVATMKLVATYALRLVESDRDERGKHLAIDEGWTLLQSREGLDLINRVNRMGRTFDASLDLGTQTIGDVPAEARKLLGSRFSFRLTDPDECRRALELHGLDENDDSLTERQLNYENGLCLTTDIYGRTGELQFDIPAHVRQALDTSPKRAARARGRGSQPAEVA